MEDCTCRILRERYVPPRRFRSDRIDTLTRAVFRVAIVAGWLYFLMRAIATFGPASDINNITFNSDSAIPVLMANDQRPITIFNFYYYCADRWGGWPFLPMQMAERIAGYHWTADSIFAVQAAWLFVGALAIAGLSRRDGVIAGLVYLIALCLHRDAHYLIFELSQVYAWQTTAMLLGWWALRRFFDRRLPSGEGRDAWSQWAWLLAAFGFSYLAIWSSVASVLFLYLLLALERCPRMVEAVLAAAVSRGAARVRPGLSGDCCGDRDRAPSENGVRALLHGALWLVIYDRVLPRHGPSRRQSRQSSCA